MLFFISEFTTLLTAAPIPTATAKSMALPRIAKVLHS